MLLPRKPLRLALVALLAGAATLQAAGPSRIARIDRKLWPHPIADAAAFDFASRLENLVFVKALMEADPHLQGAELAPFLGLKKADEAGARLWVGKAYASALENFKAGRLAKPSPLWGSTAPADVDALKRLAVAADSALPAELKPWRDAALKFYADYLYEQLRLAALFKTISSEIFTYNASEVQGDRYPDKTFLLTFDDGPTVPGGKTDQLIAWLEANGLNGTFFMLGGALKARLAKQEAAGIGAEFQGMCVASHGFEHKSHASWDQWRASVANTQALLDSVFPDHKAQERFFRPPYGQRLPAMQGVMDSLHATLILWNLDSQDWNAKIKAEEGADRMITLMLLRRRGILLYHDVHEKALIALPALLKTFAGSGIRWRDCKE